MKGSQIVVPEVLGRGLDPGMCAEQWEVPKHGKECSNVGINEVVSILFFLGYDDVAKFVRSQDDENRR